MRITQSEIESLGWVYENHVEGKFTYFHSPKGNYGKHDYYLIHAHKRDIVTICDANKGSHNEVAQGCISIEDVKQLMKSKNIPYENS